MKYYVAVLLAIAIVTVSVQAEIILTDEQVQNLEELHEACAVPGREKEFLEKLMEANGDAQKSVIVEKLGKAIEDPSKAEEYTNTCLANKSDSPTDTAYKVVKCIHDIDPKSEILSA